MSLQMSMEIAGAISTLPLEITRQMTPVRIKILDIIINMNEQQGEKSLNGAEYSYAGQQWIAEQVGCCRATVNRAVKFFKESGLVNTHVRAKRGGRFRTLLYYTGAVLRKGVAVVKALFLKSFFYVTRKSYISSDKDKISSPKVAKRSKTIKINSPPAEDLGWNTLFQRRTPENLDQCK